MGIFGGSDPVTEEVEQLTNENNSQEDWSKILNVCDKAGKSQEEAQKYLRAIVKRLFHNDPHVGLHAITLLDACVKNCGKVFHTEVASREFENDFTRLMNKAHPEVAKKLRLSLKQWSENEFKNDKQLNLIPTLYSRLKNSGLDFSNSEVPTKKVTGPVSKDPNVVESQEEEEQIAKAIQLSLQETSGSPRATSGGTSGFSSTSGAASLYPSTNLNNATAAAATPPKEPKKVRALYDFEAAEDNELTFSAGEIIFVLDDSDANWWKGSNQRGEGLFPSNFVTKDLNVEPEKFLYEKAKKIAQSQDSTTKTDLDEEREVEINETKIDRLLHLLHEADPTNPERDTEEMLKSEREVDAMGPLIDLELERVDRKHAQLTKLSADLVEALGLYHSLMREPQFPSAINVNKMPYGYPVSHGPPTSVAFNGALPSHQLPPGMVPPGLPPGHDRLQPYMMMPQPHFGPQMPPPPPGLGPQVPHQIPMGVPQFPQSEDRGVSQFHSMPIYGTMGPPPQGFPPMNGPGMAPPSIPSQFVGLPVANPQSPPHHHHQQQQQQQK